jgi:poly-gamma-glutamate capsule biosynthesis protein CapA/YwtB (metallophosphatase superfamily)
VSALPGVAPRRTSGRSSARIALGLVLAASTVTGCAAGSASPPGSAVATRDGRADGGQTGQDAVRAPGTPPAPVTIAFGGDVHFEGVVGERLRRDPATTFGPVADVLSAADLAVVNLETALTGRGTPEPKEFTFRAPATAFDALTAAGVDVATLANNHGMDYGQVGLADTLDAAREAGFPLVGAGRDDGEAFAPHVAEVDGQRIAVIGTTQVLDSYALETWRAAPGKPGLASAYDEERLLRAVREARENADTVVVFAHYGQERNPCPIARQVALTEALVEAGADVVVGSHAHVLLGGGWLGRAYVHYGLGNFLWYAKGGPEAETGVLTLTLQGRDVTAAEWTPARISGGKNTPLTGLQRETALEAADEARVCTGLSASSPADPAA